MTAKIDGVAILVWSADLAQPDRLATPFVMAQAAAALELRVELYFSAQAVRLLTPQAAGTPIGFGDRRASLGEHLAQARAAGVELRACSQALHALGLALEDLVEACSGAGGAVQFMDRCADPRWRTLVF